MRDMAESFWVGGWEHVIISENEQTDGKRPVIRQLCFGPLETLEYGVMNGKFYFESRVLEGIDEGECIFKFIGAERFIEVIQNEIALCEKHAPQLSEQVKARLDGFCLR